MKTILAPIDFSAASEAVIQEAVNFARAFDARVVLLTVVQPPVPITEYAAMIDNAQFMAAGERHASEQLEAIERKLKNDLPWVESIRETGSPVPIIVKTAKEWDADYIVMGSHGHTAFYDLIVGSTTHGVLNRAKCPVVIVPAAKGIAQPRQQEKHSAAV